jgi:hypothetical protein
VCGRGVGIGDDQRSRPAEGVFAQGIREGRARPRFGEPKIAHVPDKGYLPKARSQRAVGGGAHGIGDQQVRPDLLGKLSDRPCSSQPIEWEAWRATQAGKSQRAGGDACGPSPLH